MKGTAIVMTFALFVAAVTAAPLSGLAAPGTGLAQDASVGLDQAQAENGSEDAAPGARLAGAIGAQAAEVEGEVEARSFGIEMSKAASARAQSGVVVRQVDSLESRLADLEERKQELQAAKRNGTISNSSYEARMTTLAARTESIRGLVNQSHTAARGLPSDVAEERGINVTAIRTLERRAANLTGPEVAAIARSIAGPDTGKPVSPGLATGGAVGLNTTVGPPGNGSVGPPADRGPSAGENRTDRTVENASESARDAIDRAEDRVTGVRDRIEDVDLDVTAVTDASASADAASEDLDAARSALDDGDYEEAERLALQAIERADDADGLLDDATTESEGGQ